MMQYLAYIPYAAVGYCAAKVATDVWPTLRSQLGSMSHYSSRHGLDGEAYGPRSAEGYCPPGGGAPLGPSNLTAGARRNATQAYVSGYEMDEFGNEVVADACAASGATDPRGDYGQPAPMFRQAQPCEPTPWGRGSDGGRLARKRNRWG